MVDAAGRVRAEGFVFDVRLGEETGRRVNVAVRPEHVRIGAARDGMGLPLRIARVEDHGHDGLLHLAGRDGNARSLVSRSGQAVGFRPGDEVHVAIAPEDALYFAEDGSRLAAAPIPMANYAHG